MLRVAFLPLGVVLGLTFAVPSAASADFGAGFAASAERASPVGVQLAQDDGNLNEIIKQGSGSSDESGGGSSGGEGSSSGDSSDVLTGSGSGSSGSGVNSAAPSSSTSEVDTGAATTPTGSTRIIYTKDANGRTIGGATVTYDAQGNETSRETFTVDPNSPDGESGNAPPVPPTPPIVGPTTDVEAGTATDSKGTTKLIYTKDANGRTVGGAYVTYDSKGNVISRQTFTVDPNSPDGESGNVPPPPPPPPVIGPTHDVEAGWARDGKGKTKIIYTKDATGRTVSGTYVYTNADGKEIGRQSFPINPETFVPPNDTEDATDEADATPDGAFTGDIHGDAAGDIVFTLTGKYISGRLSGTHNNTPFSVHFSGWADEEGKFRLSATGTAHDTINNEEKDYAVNGIVEGEITGIHAAGQWSGKSMLEEASGTWSARQ